MANKFTVSTVFKGFDQTSKVVKGIGKSVNGLSRTFRIIQTAVVGGALYKLGASFVTAAADVEKYKTTLKTMLGSQELANARFEEMSKFAAKTPFELNEVVELGNQLQALGRYSEENMTILGDLASAAGKPIDQATRAFAKLASGQKGIAVDMFRDLLITTQDWVKYTGKGVSKSGQMLATTEEMLAALPKIMGAKGFSGMMAQQSLTWNGLISNMKDGFTRIKAGIGEAMLGPLKEIVATITQAAEKALAWVQANKELIGTRIKGFFDGLKTTLGIIARLWKSGLIPAILAGVIAFKAITIGVQLWTAAQVLLNAAMASNPLGLIIVGIALLIGLIILAIKNWDKITAAVKNAWSAISGFASMLWTKVVGAFRAVRDAIFRLLDNPLIAAAGAIFLPFITIPLLIAKNWETVKAVIASVIDWVMAAVQKISSAGKWVAGIFGGGGGAAAATPPAEAMVSRSVSESRSTVDLNINNIPRGSTIKQTGRAPGFTLNTGFAFEGGRL